MAGKDVTAWVPSADGLAGIAVYAQRDGGGPIEWAYVYGSDDGEVDPQEDSGVAASLDELAGDVAYSLCAVGFDTTHELVLAGFEEQGWK